MNGLREARNIGELLLICVTAWYVLAPFHKTGRRSISATVKFLFRRGRRGLARLYRAVIWPALRALWLKALWPGLRGGYHELARLTRPRVAGEAPDAPNPNPAAAGEAADKGAESAAAGAAS